MLELLTEVVKKSFIKEPINSFKKKSSTVAPDFIVKDLSSDDNIYTMGFFNSDPNTVNITGLYSNTATQDLLIKQANKINQYRSISKNTEVSNAIDEIVNEVAFNYEEKSPIIMNFETDNQGLKDAVQEAWEKIDHLCDLRYNIDTIVRKGYIDGQLIFHCTYNKTNPKKGIRSIKLIDPCYLYYDISKGIYKYHDNQMKLKTLYATPEFVEKMEYSPEEIVRVDFGLFDNFLVESYLESAIKNANMLQNLEDLLIPLRFSRSVSRRVFNVDVGDLSPSKAEEVLKNTMKQFQYKKFYNTDTGEISNQQHITSMVEDYWFANRAGGKGTQVDVLDESGNLGELSDILYFCKKLYRSMKVPTSRIDINPDGNAEFGYNADQITVEDMRFFMFCMKLRHVYVKAFKEILKRELISTKVVSPKEYEMIEENIILKFVNENAFFEKMKLDNFTAKIEIWHNIQEDTGRILPVTKVFKDVFKMSDDEIEETLKTIQEEARQKKFKIFYQNEDGESLYPSNPFDKDNNDDNTEHKEKRHEDIEAFSHEDEDGYGDDDEETTDDADA